MDVVINGERRQLPDATSLAQAVALLTSSATGLAVAVNGEVVRRPAWAGTELAAGDEVELLTAVQGG
jgi:sulfur carrier protein